MSDIVKLKDVFSEVKEFLGNEIIALETGMPLNFKRENLDNTSIYNIAKYLIRGGHFLSKLDVIGVDYKSSKKFAYFLAGRDLLASTFFYNNNSIDVMDWFIKNGYQFNFFWLDSCEDKDHGLKEYMRAKVLMKRPAVICIDNYGATGSIKWILSSQHLKEDATYYKTYRTATNLIVGFYE